MSLAGIGGLTVTTEVTGVVELDRSDNAGIRSEDYKVYGKPIHSIEDSVWRSAGPEAHHLKELDLSKYNMMGERLHKSSI